MCNILQHKLNFAREIRERLGEPDIGDGSFRERITPKLNFEAKTLQKLIEWEDVTNEPVLTTEIPTSKFFDFKTVGFLNICFNMPSEALKAKPFILK